MNANTESAKQSLDIHTYEDGCHSLILMYTVYLCGKSHIQQESYLNNHSKMCFWAKFDETGFEEGITCLPCK